VGFTPGQKKARKEIQRKEGRDIDQEIKDSPTEHREQKGKPNHGLYFL